MKSTLKFVTVLVLLAALVLVAAPTQAATGTWVCTVSPGSGPVGTVFTITCAGFSPNTNLWVYAVEPDGRASGIDIYGFFPTGIKTNGDGVASFNFVTEIPGFSSVPPGDYTFVIQQLAPGGKSAIEAHVPVNVGSSARPLVGASLSAKLVDTTNNQITYLITGSGYLPGDNVNTWVTQPPAANCSGLGIDQLTLGDLAGNGSSLWAAPGTVQADMAGDIAFDITFYPGACRGDHIVSARSPKSGIGAEVSVSLPNASEPAANASVWVSPSAVPAIESVHTVNGSGFPAGAIVNCWYTRPDGRVLSFIDVNAKADAAGDFSVSNTLDDFAPYTSTEPGTWTVTCATPDRSVLGEATFGVFALTSDP